MGTAKTKHQRTTPMIIDSLELSGTASALDRLSLVSKEHNEGFIQTLVYRYPQLLTVSEIEAAFGSLISVCTELPTPVGSIDNLYVTERGNLAIAECKLWRNPEARRRVLAQIIDYAQSIAGWTYADLEKAIRSGHRPEGEKISSGLFSLVSDNTELDEPSFIDAVTRNLRLGRMLLLLVGDGIQEGTETLAEYLQKHAGFHFTLGIIELALFKLPINGFLVQPRILSRTVNIERGIVRLVDGRVTVEPSPELRSAQPTSMSEDQLFEKLEKNTPQTASALRRFREEAKEFGVFFEPTEKALHIRWGGPNDEDYALGGIRPDGKLRTMTVNFKPDRIGKIDLSHEYLAKIATLIGSDVRRTKDPKGWYVGGSKDRLPDAIDLLSKSRDWLEIIQWYTEKLSAATEADSV